MSKMAWERAAGKAAKLATVSVIAAVATTTSVAAESAVSKKTQGAKVPASYSQPMARSGWGLPSYGQPFGAAPAQYGAPGYGQMPQMPGYGHAPAGLPQYGAPQLNPAVTYGRPTLQRPMIAPASTATFAPSGATTTPALTAPQLPQHLGHRQMPVQPQFGQRQPIFANTQANGITYGPPSYTKPKDFDPKMASSSPFPSAWSQGNWTQQQRMQMQQQHMQLAPQMPMPAPNLAGAPVYSNAWAQQQLAPASVSRFAPAEPSYAPAEPLRPNYSAAPAGYVPAAPATYEAAAPAPAPSYETVDVTPAAPATVEVAPAPASTQTYSYEMAPATAAPAYVGQSTELGASTYQTAPAPAPVAANPYEVVIGQSGEVKTYDPAPAYQQAPAYDPAPAYTAPAAAAQQTSAYEMTTEAAPAYPVATSYGAQSYEPVTTAAPAYETATAAPVYEAAPAYQAAIQQTNYGSSSFASGNNHFVQVGAFRNPARAERLVRKLQGAGEQPIVTQATVRGKLYHRVRVPAMDKRDAKSVQSRIRGLGFYEARMVRG